LAAARVDYKASVASDLARLDPPIALRILKRIEKSLVVDGGSGEPLAGEFAGLLRLRVGDNRVIYTRTSAGFLVLRIAHRGEV
jgi:mRNA-degrading endonuclease RelE of RelBE toxin-antitoxin system